MRNIQAAVAISLACILVLSSCAGSSEPAASNSENTPAASAEAPTAAPSPTEIPAAAAEPTTTTAAEPTATATPVPTATPEPEPTPVLAVSDSTGEFQCANQEPREVTIDAGISSELEMHLGDGVPGLVAAAASSQGLLRVGSAGVRASNGDDALLATDRVHLGSDTKAMTGTLLALLAEQGEIELTTAITDIWPDADSGWDGVTLLDLLHHRGGAEDSLGRDQAGLWQQLWNASISSHSASPEQRAESAKTERSRFATTLTSAAPSEEVGQYAYSNSGYMLVGAALEAQLGAPWEALMCEHLFGPLRMDGCGFGAPQGPAPQGHSGQAGNLTPTDSALPQADNPFALGPAGTVHCPVADWSRFLSWVLRGARGEDDRLPPEIWEMLLEPEGDYAAGWGVFDRPWASGTTYTHAGSNTMWFAIAWVAPGIDRAYLAVANAATANAQRATDSAIGYLIESER